ncbi:putative glycosyltransferase EpsH [Enhygromyxa salina]|uniref:Putative glycosyltransferase EpsH n=1 Tax=Enhygromyxa salina TaxID=215803 RepID=A0A2S9XBW6_9BACT|nr:glycosyltransferase [Enhygromyxa salina]PRP90349.1 putative glycosyltransferase EpsH [Enhygromyxa salina]
MMDGARTTPAPRAASRREAAIADELARTSRPGPRPRVRGKFLVIGDHELWVRGVTYGTFAGQTEGEDYPPDAVLERDFATMRANGVNAVRCYTAPPRRLLDAAWRHGLRVMVGLAWEQHVAFLEDPGRARDIARRVGEGVRRCAGHPAVLCYVIGNEIPASIVRWHGRRRVERFLRRLYRAAKREDPDGLVTYVNFPTTEYLNLPFLDLCCFNVYLECDEQLAAYLARLQNLAGDRPLLMAEIGLDSQRKGLDEQARGLAGQVRTTFAAGCAGAFIFAWTDEWHRGGCEIEDWDFGLVTRDRQAKPALAAVRRALVEVPFAADEAWPRISVVVCSFNGAATIRDTLRGLRRLEYPDYEVIVVDDGSTDATPKIVAEYPEVWLIRTENRGLSAARNLGWQAAEGEIVAYIDDDAYPDPHWLHFLAHGFTTGDWVGVGGPNLAPPGDGPIADCVANAPGGPVQVLISDVEAEHIPGCNMAFRREALAAIDGFDPRYRAAGDDVDLCWRLQESGGRIGFHAGAMNWHHRRNSLIAYWRQQIGYGKAEALLEDKWPERYSAVGHLAWAGRLYGRGVQLAIPFGRARVRGGVWGSAAYQSLYEPAPSGLLALPLMPEWWLVIAALAALALLGLSWPPLLLVVPAVCLAIAAPLTQAAIAASRARFPVAPRSRGEALQRWLLTFCMHLVQPLARLTGRIRHGLTPWRRRGRASTLARARPAQEPIWAESWESPERRLERLEGAVRAQGVIVRRGGELDDWDLELRGGLCSYLRTVVAVEEHGQGKQLIRAAARPRTAILARVSTLVSLALAVAAAHGEAWIAAAALLFAALVFARKIQRDHAVALGGWVAAWDQLRSRSARGVAVAQPDETGPDETGPDETGPDEAGPDETGPDETGPDETGPAQVARGAEPEPREPTPAADPRPVAVAEQARHPAATAWARISAKPVRAVAPIREPRPFSRNSAIYRLCGAGVSGGDVIAKHASRPVFEIERVAHEQVLPRLAVPRIQLYGAVESNRDGWLFLEDAGERAFDDDHGGVVATWLGRFHVAAAAASATAGWPLPSQHASRFRTRLEVALERVHDALDQPRVADEDRRKLRRLVSLSDALLARWAELAGLADAMPTTLVHGDLAAKNGRLRTSSAGLELVMLDWEMAGYGSPAIDLGALWYAYADPRPLILGPYAAEVGRAWGCSDADIERATLAGRALRIVAAIEWASVSLPYPPVARSVRKLRRHVGRLEQLMTDLGPGLP